MPKNPTKILSAARAERRASWGPLDLGDYTLSPEQLDSIEGMFKKRTSELHGVAVKTALTQRKARGDVFGQVPYGWKRDGMRLTADAAEQAAIDRMLALWADGMTAYGIAKTLQKEGHPVRGAKWWERSVRNILAAHADARAAASSVASQAVLS